MTRRRVIQWGTGAVGIESLGFVLDAPDLDLVGVKCHSHAKAGKDAGSLSGRPPVGVAATQDDGVLLSMDADCVLFMPRDGFSDPTVTGSPSQAWVNDVVRILESGKNVISPLHTAMHWRQLSDGDTLRRRLQAACRTGGTSAFFTGLDPGFVSDCLTITLSSASGAIECVRTLEVIDYSTYQATSTLSAMGFGADPDEIASATDDSLIPGWGCALWLVADSLGIEIDDILLDTRTFAAPSSFVTEAGMSIAAGTVGALQWSITAMVAGRPRIVARHIARAHPDIAPQWPHIGDKGGYRVEIDGTPPLRVDMPLGLPGGTGTCLGDAIQMTAARCVNAVDAVVSAPVGYHLLTAMPIIGGRHTFYNPRN